MLRRRDQTAGTLADAFAVSRPAVSRHLRVLREAGLVRDTLHGRHRDYQLVVPALDELAAYLQALREGQQGSIAGQNPRLAGSAAEGQRGSLAGQDPRLAGSAAEGQRG